VNDDRSVLRKVSKNVGLYLVLFLLGIVSRHSSTVIAPRPFDHALFAEKVGAFQCAFFIGGFED
jgi:hypothetical protein